MKRFAPSIYVVVDDATLKVPSQARRLKNSEQEKPLNEEVCCQKELHLYHLFFHIHTENE